MTNPDELTWKCDGCHEERPDRFISVYSSRIPGFEGFAVRNWKYCNDRGSCLEKVMQKAIPGGIQTDDYGEVINHEGTYKGIAEVLKERGRCLIGWTDQQMSHFDILFVVQTPSFGSFRGGIRPMTDLFVSVMRWGAFAFDLEEHDTHWGYIDEKLGAGGRSLGETTGREVADLINGIRKEFVLL